MNITRHLCLATALRAPDDGVGTADPVIETVAPAEVAATDPPAAEAAPAEVVAVVPPPAPTIPMSVFQRRVGEETSKRQAVERRATEAEARAAEYQAIIERMQAGQADPAADQTRTVAPRAVPAQQPDLEEAVRRVVDQRETSRSISDVVQRGVSEFTEAQWNEKSAILASLGAASPEFVQDVIAVDSANAHRIIFALAEDPGKAADLASMPLRQRTAELTRMSMTEQAKTTTPAAGTAPAAPVKTAISKAPAPVALPRAHAEQAAVDPTTPEGDGKMTDEQWGKWFKAEGAKKLFRTA